MTFTTTTTTATTTSSLSSPARCFHSSTSILLSAEGGDKPLATAVVDKDTTVAPTKEVPSPAAKAEAEEKEFAPASSSNGEYSSPELTRDAALHKAGLDDPTRPSYQNPLHHDNPDMEKIFREDFNSDEEFEAAMLPAPAFADSGEGPTAAPEYLHEIADEIVHLTMLEMNELINKIADHYGFHEGMLSPDDQDMGDEADDVGGGAAAAAVVEEKTTFDVKLVGYEPTAKIKVIKEVRAILGLGLKEAKEMVEGAPKTLLKGVKKEQCEEIKAKLEEIGGTIEIV
jgi:large subunit ribosomal protein L7/L12